MGLTVIGNILVSGDSLLINFKIVKVETASIPAAGSVQGKTGSILAIKNKLSANINTQLAMFFPDIEKKTPLPQNPEPGLETME